MDDGKRIIELISTDAGNKIVRMLGVGPKTREELAASVSVTGEAFGRMLDDLEQTGVIAVENDTITLKNPTALEFAKAAHAVPEKHRKTLLDMGLFEDPILTGILNALGEETLTGNEIAAKINTPLTEVVPRLDALVDAGIVEREDNTMDHFRMRERNSI